MKIQYLFFSLTLMITISCSAQAPVDVTDQKIKIGGFNEEELYFGFAEGDKILFNFEEIDKKELKEVEVIEYPGNSKFSDFKTKKIENKTFNVSRQGVYIFRFKNSAMGGRICRIQIQRIPANDVLKNFNSTVSWVVKQDTSWNSFTKDVVIGYDTTYVQRTTKELVKSEKVEEMLLDKKQRVNSSTNANGNKSMVFFTLPVNQVMPYQTRKVISWAYWVGVGEEASDAWRSNAKAIAGLAKTAVGSFTSPLGALALGTVTDLMIPNVGEDVFYAITDEQNKNLFFTLGQFRARDQGRGVAGYHRFVEPAMLQGRHFVCLNNDNVMVGIDADIKVVAIVETNTYQDKNFTETVSTPRYEKQLFREPTITSAKVPVSGM